jgi:hypothetical protein
MKLTPFLLFLLILFVLGLAVMFGNSLQNEYAVTQPIYNAREGFEIQYKQSTAVGGNVKIPFYSQKKDVHKLHDNIYYDFTNGTIIVLQGTLQSGNTSASSLQVDEAGTTITGMSYYTRNGGGIAQTKTFKEGDFAKLGADHYIDVSKKTSLETSYQHFSIFSDTGSTGDTNGVQEVHQVLYIPWGKETYIHVIALNPTEATNKYTMKYTYAYDSTGTLIEISNVKGNGDTATDKFAIYNNVKLTQKFTNPDLSKDGTLLNVPGYDAGNYKYQICSNTFYNQNNGDVIVLKPDTKLKILSRVTGTTRIIQSSNTFDYDATTKTFKDAPVPSKEIANVSRGFATGVITTGIDDTDDYYSILYTSIGLRTILVCIKLDKLPAIDARYEIYKVYRFNDKKIDDGSVAASTSGSSAGGNNTPPEKGELNDWLMDYLKAYYGGTYNGLTINDYMLKTQIVPPVCPTCPTCPSSGVCNSCGGKGGSGTQRAQKSKLDKNKDKYYDSDEDYVRDKRSQKDSNLLRDTGSGTASLLRDAGSGTASLARDTVGGTVGLAKDVVGGTVGLAKDAVGGTVGLAKDAVGGTVGLAKDVVGGTLNTFGRLAPTQLGGESGGGSSNSGQYAPSGTVGSDPISYFGALPSKGGNYIPVTADFSKFGR